MSDKLCPTVSKIDVSSVFDTDEESFGKMMDIIHNPNPFNKEYTEKHHIIPRFVFRNKGLDIDNSPDNIVELSLKNHFLVHYYASKCCKNEYKYRFAVAVTKMLGHIYDNFSEDELEKIATMVEEAKENVRKLGYPETAREKNRLASLGVKNGFYGRTHTDESKKVMSEKSKLHWKEHPEWKKMHSEISKKQVGEKNGFYGRHHTRELKERLSRERKGISRNVGTENPFYGKKHSEETRRLLKEVAKKRREAWNDYKLKNPEGMSWKEFIHWFSDYKKAVKNA